MSVVESSMTTEDSEKWTRLPDDKSIVRTVNALQSRGITAESVSTREDALKLLAKRIPPGAEVMTGASATLDEIGFLQLLKLGTHQWKNLKSEITGEKDPVRQRELRVRAAAAQYFVGSAHAVAETGEIVVASASGSQIPAYAYSSNYVFWVVGAQKIVASLDEGLRRVREYCLPMESAKMRSLGYPGSAIGKLLIFERERASQRSLTLILVNEKLGV